MKNLSLLLAWRYLRNTSHEKNINTMTKISFFGILIGTFSLALVMAVMNGFETATHQKMQNIHAQVSMHSFGSILDSDAIVAIIKGEFPQIQAASAHDMQNIMIQDPHSDSIHSVVGIKGIFPQTERLVTTLEQTIVSENKSLQQAVADNKLLIGEKLAHSLGIKTGDTIAIMFAPSEQSSMKIKLEKREMIVGGLFSTGIEEQDSSMVFCNFDFLTKIFPDAGVTQIDLKLKPGANEDTLIEALQIRFNMDVYSWKELYPALVSALKLEKYVMFLILALITLVASMNIISLLFMQITQKLGDIAILQSMGTTKKAVRSIFVYMGLFLTFVATSLGLALAYGASIILERYPFIELPDIYYVTHLPADMQWHIIIAVFTAVMLLSFVSIWIPTQRIHRIKIADVLRFEA